MDRPSLDRCARLVIMASYFYYRHDVNMMTDDEFDTHCRRLARNFHLLSDGRQFFLGDAESIRSSGYHVLISVLAQDACLHYAKANDLKLNWSRGIITRWKVSREPTYLRYAGLAAS